MQTQEQQRRPTPLTIRVGGRIAAELTRIANKEENSITAVAKRLIAEALEREAA